MSDEISQLQLIVDKLLSNKKDIKALEAGCGSCSRIDMGKEVYLVGIDISEEQLQKNSTLNEKILGDIQSYDLPTSEFDIIVCWDVLEHISQPKKALENLIKALKKDGFIVLAIPNILSVKGTLTKYTPHWFHVWVYRNLLGYKLAGKEGHLPFRTILRFSIAPKFIKQFAHNNNLSIEYYSIYECQKQKDMRRNKFFNIILNVLVFLIKILSIKKINANLTDYIIVLKKNN
jgi:2-polyprenyl-3-methyl-5-hydroxy-6-metoxy-1,4-benzoquinol methylase